ncbi:YopX family protein [Bacillus sp. alh8]|uniref:YopX family protein n=1 Tax=Bacillus sp. alh8 TaxID=3421242 RepID=UPI003D16C831
MNEYRVWDGKKMYYWDDGELYLIISGGEWGLYRNNVTSLHASLIASSNQKNAVLMWGTGRRDEEGRMIYPGNKIEYYTEDFSIITKKVRLVNTIEVIDGLHNVPGDYAKNIRIIGDVYEEKGGTK